MIELLISKIIFNQYHKNNDYDEYLIFVECAIDEKERNIDYMINTVGYFYPLNNHRVIEIQTFDENVYLSVDIETLLKHDGFKNDINKSIKELISFYYDDKYLKNIKNKFEEGKRYFKERDKDKLFNKIN